MSDNRPCPCGSGKPSWWENDARNIPLFRVCDDCQAKKLATVRPDVLTDSNYWADEAIEGED
jgi:hypothetical protein